MGGGHQAVQVLLLGVLSLAVADTLHVVSGSPVDAELPGPALTTLTAFGLIAVAAWLDRGPDVDDPPRAASLILPILCVVVATGLLVGASWDAFQTGTTILAAVTVLVGAGRLGLAIKSEGSASDSLRQALTDDLTGLPNRRHFYVNLREALRSAQRTRVPLALLLIDLDRFKEVNDSLGHLAGDDVLRQLRPRLAKVMRGSGLVARIGGDEFAMVLPLGSTSTEAVNMGRRVISALEAPFELDGFEVRMGASVGVAVFPVHGTTADELLQRADVAMYLAKAGDEGVEVYDPSRDPNSRQRLELTSQLRDAINGTQLVLHYQPKVSVRTGRVEGVEALVRWEHPTRGLLLPSAFLDLVRQSGLMRPLMLTVLRQSLEQVRTWLNLGLALRVDINLSASNIADDRLLDDIDRALREARVPAEMLGIEVTEDLLLAEPERAEVVLTELRARGVSISLDDFGSGYSSLAYLGRLPVDELKIDRYFVERLRTNPQAEAIVRSTVELAHSLGMSFVAEGVEDDDQLRVLRALGCDSAQGYLVSKPLPAAALAEWLSARGALPTTPPSHHHGVPRRRRSRPSTLAWHPPGERMVTRIG
jgi:diguanylate cyclase (GGDEF)-like protein